MTGSMITEHAATDVDFWRRRRTSSATLSQARLRGRVIVMGLIGDTPRGQEEQVYFMALAAIDPDNRAERDFLERLGSAFGLSQEARAVIHQRLGMPPPIRPAM